MSPTSKYIWQRLRSERDALIATGVDREIAVRDAVGLVESMIENDPGAPSCPACRHRLATQRFREALRREQKVSKSIGNRQPAEVAA